MRLRRPGAVRVDLRTYAQGWRDSLVARPATLSIVDNAVDVRILPVPWDRQMVSIRRSGVQGLVKCSSRVGRAQAVQTVLGHSSAAITLRVYSHMWPGDDERIRSVMDGALVALADQVRTEEASS